MVLHRPYRALLIADLNNLGLTPQAIQCRPFGAPEKKNKNLLCKGCSWNEHAKAPPKLRTLHPGFWILNSGFFLPFAPPEFLT